MNEKNDNIICINKGGVNISEIALVLLFMYFALIIAFVFFNLNEMPNFIKDMPNKKDWFKLRKVTLNVNYTFPNLRSVEVENKESYGFTILHYIKVRMMALKYDKNPPFEGEDYGVIWSISKCK